MKKLFTISEFAKLRNININSLRYYERIGVLRPACINEQTGYRYYSPDQLPILDVILLCLDFGMPLKELKTYIDNDEFIKNSDLFEAGRLIAQERLRHAQTELNKINYTLQYLDANRQFREKAGLYERDIAERRIITAKYTGDLSDIRNIEMMSARLYEYAQGSRLAPVFPTGLILESADGVTEASIFFEIMTNDETDDAIAIIPRGKYLCRQVNLSADVKITDTIDAAYGEVENARVIVSNMLLDKYQLGTKKSELQMIIE